LIGNLESQQHVISYLLEQAIQKSEISQELENACYFFQSPNKDVKIKDYLADYPPEKHQKVKEAILQVKKIKSCDDKTWTPAQLESVKLIASETDLKANRLGRQFARLLIKKSFKNGTEVNNWIFKNLCDEKYLLENQKIKKSGPILDLADPSNLSVFLDN